MDLRKYTRNGRYFGPIQDIHFSFPEKDSLNFKILKIAQFDLVHGTLGRFARQARFIIHVDVTST